MSQVRATITKNASLAATARYISIATIFTVSYLQVFNAEHFFSSTVSIAMICKERSIGLPWFSTKPQIMTLLVSKQGRTQLVYSTEQTIEHVFENFGAELSGCSPPDFGICCKTCQHHLETRAANVWDFVQSDQ